MITPLHRHRHSYVSLHKDAGNKWKWLGRWGSKSLLKFCSCTAGDTPPVYSSSLQKKRRKKKRKKKGGLYASSATFVLLLERILIDLIFLHTSRVFLQCRKMCRSLRSVKTKQMCIFLGHLTQHDYLMSQAASEAILSSFSLKTHINLLQYLFKCAKKKKAQHLIH